jgi:hypothetical protein
MKSDSIKTKIPNTTRNKYNNKSFDFTGDALIKSKLKGEDTDMKNEVLNTDFICNDINEKKEKGNSIEKKKRTNRSVIKEDDNQKTIINLKKSNGNKTKRLRDLINEDLGEQNNINEIKNKIYSDIRVDLIKENIKGKKLEFSSANITQKNSSNKNNPENLKEMMGKLNQNKKKENTKSI